MEQDDGDWPGALVDWFEREHRPMPWRSDPSPYKVWISEIMLQQTQVATVIPYFDRFTRRFPTVAALAAASLQEVLKCWEGLGYYSRARHLHEAARRIVAGYGGQVPASHDALLGLPGVGAYTAAAIASIAFGEPAPCVDGNVLRVCSRLWGIDTPIRHPRVAADIRERLAPLIRRVNPSSFNQALMETGALVCRPRRPVCHACVLAPHCVAFRTGRTEDFPVVTPAARTPHYTLAAGVVWKRGRLLIARRHERQMLGGLWEFPGGQRARGGTLAQAAARAIREETGLEVSVGPRFATVRHAYSHFRVTVSAFRCEWRAGVARPTSAVALKWIPPAALTGYPMSRVNRRIAEALLTPRKP
jgi:A/G-specific adenine glycosylase